MAKLTVMFGHNFFNGPLGPLGGSVIILSLEVVHDPLKPGLPSSVTVGGLTVEGNAVVSGTIQNLLKVPPFHVFDRHIYGEPVMVSNTFIVHFGNGTAVRLHPAGRFDSTIMNRQRLIGH